MKIYDISRLRVKDLHSATYIYVVRRLRVKNEMTTNQGDKCELVQVLIKTLEV